MSFRLAAVLLCGVLPAAEEEAGRILRPVEHAAFRSGPVEVIATAPEGVLELDGVRVAADRPFPNVLHARVEVKPGVHTLVLSWPGGRKQIQFSMGSDTPRGFQAFRAHPPPAGAPCTQCHELSRRGRFVFKGGCLDCHESGGFANAHTHTPEVLSECGLCHNAHGSITARHLLHTKEVACKQCHN
jgi:predicted CXXCH cytochrome family protein